MEWLLTEKEIIPEFWDEVQIEELGLSANIFKLLYEAGIVSIGQLSRYTAYDLSKIPHLGEKSIQEIETKLSGTTGLHLKI